VGTPARISMATPPASPDVDVTDDDPPASSSASSRTAASPSPEKPPVTAATLPPSNPLVEHWVDQKRGSGPRCRVVEGEQSAIARRAPRAVLLIGDRAAPSLVLYRP
jgi:hypothetical protein